MEDQKMLVIVVEDLDILGKIVLIIIMIIVRDHASFEGRGAFKKEIWTLLFLGKWCGVATYFFTKK